MVVVSHAGRLPDGVVGHTGAMDRRTVTPAEIAELPGLDDWRFVLASIHTELRAGSFAAAAALVAEIAALADQADHHPDIDLRYPDRVRVVLSTHSAGGVTTLDVELARQISQLASDAGATAEPERTQLTEIAIDTMDPDRIRPFWAAVLGYDVDADGNLVDPLRLGPPLWFQQMDEPRPQRNRVHFDVSVPHDVAEARLAAAIGAGGTLLDESRARAFWVLADAEGNEACICTWQDR